MDKKLKIFKDISDINDFAAQKIVSSSKVAINKKGNFTIALSGGSTPKSLYKLLTTNEFKRKIEWENVFFFFSDERDVSPMSDRSNFRMVNECLLTPLGIAPRNIFRWQTEIINAKEVAEQYSKTITKFFNLQKGEFPSFDLILLGIGADGHTASLFPNTEALKIENKIAVSNYIEKFNSERLTFTFPTINSALSVLVLAFGKEKSNVLKNILEGEDNHNRFPAQLVKPNNGSCSWIIDEGAASLLSK